MERFDGISGRQIGLDTLQPKYPLPDTMPPERAKNGIIRYVFTVPKFGREFVVTSGQLRNIAGYQDSSDTASEWLVANLGIGRYTYGILVCSRNQD